MARLIWEIFGTITSLSMATIATTIIVVAYKDFLRDRYHNEKSILLKEKLKAYREILDAIVIFNQLAVELGDDKFGIEADNIAFERGSELDDAYNEIHKAFESNLHLIDDGVRNAVSEFLDYPATYHEEGARLDNLLHLGGEVIKEIRNDIDIASVFENK